MMSGSHSHICVLAALLAEGTPLWEYLCQADCLPQCLHVLGRPTGGHCQDVTSFCVKHVCTACGLEQAVQPIPAGQRRPSMIYCCSFLVILQ